MANHMSMEKHIHRVSSPYFFRPEGIRNQKGKKRDKISMVLWKSFIKITSRNTYGFPDFIQMFPVTLKLTTIEKRQFVGIGVKKVLCPS